jgi:hypothetical protein
MRMLHRLPYPLRLLCATIFVVLGYIPITMHLRVGPLRGAQLAWQMWSVVAADKKNWWFRK